MALRKFPLLLGIISLPLFGWDKDYAYLKWKRYVGKGSSLENQQPLIYGDKILHATYGDKCCNKKKEKYDKLYVFDKDGNLLWSFSSPDGGKIDLNGVVACDEFIAVTSDEGYVYSLSWDGKIRWKQKVGRYPFAFSISDINGDGFPDVLVGDIDEELHLLDGETGREIWSFEADDDIYSSPAIGGRQNDIVYVGSDDHKLYALNAWRGYKIWEFETQGKIKTSPAVADVNGDGVEEVIFGSLDKNLYVLNAKKGYLIWKFKTSGEIWSSPAVGDIDNDGKLEIVFGSTDKNIYALNGENGSLLWKFQTGGEVNSPPSIGDIDGDGELEVISGSDDSYLYILDGKSGELEWEYKTGGGIASSPALGDVDNNGKIDIVVASWDGYLYRFESSKIGGKIVWSRWHGDAKGTGNYMKSLEFVSENIRALKPLMCNKTEIIHYGKDYLIQKGSVFITSLSGIVEEPSTYRGLDLSTATYCKLFRTYTPTGLINSLNLPTVEFVLFWNTKGREVKAVNLNGEPILYNLYGDFVKTAPIVGNFFRLKTFTLTVKYSNGQSYSYQCHITKSLEISCTEMPKLFFPSFNLGG